MADCLEVPCFRYDGRDLAARLDVEPRAGAGTLVRCRVRHGLYVLTPEERVRQALLWFLVEGASSAVGWRSQLRFHAEHSSLDVAAYYAGPEIHQAFSPNVPVLIVETKRQELELADDSRAEDQLKTYMLRERCRAGLIFSARQAAWLSLNGEFKQPSWAKTSLADLREAEERICQAAGEVATRLTDSGESFRSAATGDFDSLLRLVSLFGADSSLTFGLSIRANDSVSLVQAFSLQTADSRLVTYRARGVVSRNRQHLPRRDFHRLLAIRPL